MKLPSALEVVAPSAQPHARRLGVAGVVVLLEVGVTLLRPWPLAIAVDVAIDDRPGPSWLPSVPGDVLLVVLAGVASVLITACVGIHRPPGRPGRASARRSASALGCAGRCSPRR